MAKKDNASPATTSMNYDIMAPRWAKIDTLLGGTETMRAAGELYLPKHDQEATIAYRERLAAVSLFNATELTLDAWVGKPFSEPITILDETPPQVVDLLDDIDLQGNNIDVFCRQWFRSGVAKSLSHVLIDFPKMTMRPDGQPRTLDDDRRENLRPYWINIEPERILFAASEMVNGQEMLTHLRILDHVVEVDGFAEVIKTQIRVFTPGQIDTYEKAKRKKGGKDVWQLVQTETYDLDFIPLVTFYSDRQGLMLGKPPLEDLADLNVTHWQSSSDQRATLTVARFPVLALSGGADDNKVLTIGPRKWLYTPDANGRFYYVEHTGKALEAGRMDLEELEKQMAHYGADYMRKRVSGETATGRAIDQVEATSPLQDAVNRFTDAVNTALYITAQWMKLDFEGGVQVHNDFGPESNEIEQLKPITEARKNRDISRRTYLNEMKRRDVLAEDFDIDEEINNIEQEALTFAPAPFASVNDGGENDDNGEDGEGGEE
jgi:hypothetical protein